MNFLTPKEISIEFSAKTAKFRSWAQESGADVALQNLSKAIADLKASGVEVSLVLGEYPSEQAFSMFKAGGLTTPLSGILRIGGVEKLIALTVKENDEPCLKLGVSMFDIRFNGANFVLKDTEGTNAVRATVYDLKNDQDSIVKFQRDIILIAARTAVIRENDAAGAFSNDEDGLRKSSPKQRLPL